MRLFLVSILFLAGCFGSRPSSCEDSCFCSCSCLYPLLVTVK